jgi:hypothetical protein
MCGPVAGILSAIAPFVPIISKFIGGGQRQQGQQQQPTQRRNVAPTRRELQTRGRRVEDEEGRTQETDTAMSEAALARRKRYSGGVNTQADKAQRTAADQGSVGQNINGAPDPTGLTS